MNKALLVGAAIAVFALLSVMAIGAEKPAGHSDWAVVAQAGSYGSSGSTSMERRGTTGTQPSKSHKMQPSRTTTGKHKTAKSTGAKAGAGPSMKSSRYHKTGRYGAGPSKMTSKRYRTHRMPRTGMDFGLLSFGGAALAMAGFALRRRIR